MSRYTPVLTQSVSSPDGPSGATSTSSHSSSIGLIVGLGVGLLLTAIFSGVIVYLLVRSRNAPRTRAGPGPFSPGSPTSPGPTVALMVESYIVDRPLERSPTPITSPSVTTTTAAASLANTNRHSKTSDALMVSPSLNLNSELAALYKRSGRNTDFPIFDDNARLSAAQLDIVAKLLEREMPGEDIATIVRSMTSPAPPLLSAYGRRNPLWTAVLRRSYAAPRCSMRDVGQRSK